MTKQFWIGVGILATVVVALSVRSVVNAREDAAGLSRQLRLASSEGLATNGSQYAAGIDPAPPNDNAAPLYRQISKLVARFDSTVNAANIALIREPTAANLAAAQQVLKTKATILNLADRAALLPRCWFDWNWDDCYVNELGEFTAIKAAAQTVDLRGSVAAAQGDAKRALSCTAEAFKISDHAGEEGSLLSALVADNIRATALRTLASWCLMRPDRPSFRTAFADFVEHHLPPPNLKREFREALFQDLYFLDMSQTREGLHKLGFKDEDVPKGPNLVALFMSQPRAKIAIIKADRDAFAALDKPWNELRKGREEAAERRDNALVAFPLAARNVQQLRSGDNLDPAVERVLVYKAMQVRCRALIRAFAVRPAAHHIDCADLLSPYTGKPLLYAFDGKSIRIDLDKGSSAGPETFLVPPARLRH